MAKDSRIQELIRKAPTKGVATIGEERKMFLDAAFEEHFGAELAGDLPAINASYSKDGGHLNFNGVLYESEEEALCHTAAVMIRFLPLSAVCCLVFACAPTPPAEEVEPDHGAGTVIRLAP